MIFIVSNNSYSLTSSVDVLFKKLKLIIIKKKPPTSSIIKICI